MDAHFLQGLSEFLASWSFRNKVTNSASAVDAATCLSVAHEVWIAPLRNNALPCCGLLPRHGQRQCCSEAKCCVFGIGVGG